MVSTVNLIIALRIFSQLWRPGRLVREVAPPHRTGRIITVSGTGRNANIIVALTGGHPTSFHPDQLTPL